MIKVKNYKRTETFIEGYSQPFIAGIFNDGAHFVIEDSSCGDFGRRIFIKVSSKFEVYSAYYGEMLQGKEEFSTFSCKNRHAEMYAKAIEESFAQYIIPRAEEFFKEEELVF